MIKNKGAFLKGLALAVSFYVVLGIMFMPIFGNNENALKAADRLFNSISKDSSNYFPKLTNDAKKFDGSNITVELKLSDDKELKSEKPKGMKGEQKAAIAEKLLKGAGATVTKEAGSASFKASGDLGKIMAAALLDSKDLYDNKDISAKYGNTTDEVVYVWRSILVSMDDDLKKRQKKFAEAKFISEAVKKGLEVAYNYRGIEGESAMARAGILSFSLIFYVIYTLWWGIAVLFMFEGIGLEMKKGHKKEH